MGKKNEIINISRLRKDKIKREWTESHSPYSSFPPWIEPIDEEVDIWQLYQIQNNEDYTEPNSYGEIHLGNQDLAGYNSDVELHDWEVKNYETQARGCWTIQAMQKKRVHQCFSISITPKIFERKTRE